MARDAAWNWLICLPSSKLRGIPLVRPLQAGIPLATRSESIREHADDPVSARLLRGWQKGGGGTSRRSRHVRRSICSRREQSGAMLRPGVNGFLPLYPQKRYCLCAFVLSYSCLATTDWGSQLGPPVDGILYCPPSSFLSHRGWCLTRPHTHSFSSLSGRTVEVVEQVCKTSTAPMLLELKLGLLSTHAKSMTIVRAPRSSARYLT
jgi:hypothetical protein